MVSEITPEFPKSFPGFRKTIPRVSKRNHSHGFQNLPMVWNNSQCFDNHSQERSTSVLMTVHFLRISTDYAYPQGRYPKLRMIVIWKRWKTSENTRKTTKKTQKNSGRLTPARKTLGIKNPGNFFRDPQNPGNFSPGFPGLPWEKCHTDWEHPRTDKTFKTCS